MTLRKYSINNGTLSVDVTDFGASLVDLRLKGIDHALVLGFPDIESYTTDGQFMGAVIGRYANRIDGGTASIDGRPLSLERNENGEAHLHGGANGYARQIWAIDEATDTAITFELISPDGHAGYPGALTAKAIYEVDDATLRLTLQATSDKDTIVNLCHHPYFNFDGQETIDDHQVWINAEHYLPSNDALVPTGEIAPVANTPYEFRALASLRPCDYNNTYCLHHEQTGPLTHMAQLQGGRVTMDLHTTQPGIHFYNGYKVQPKSDGHNGKPYVKNAGICLEAQAWPDSPNHTEFPDVVLRAGTLYEQITEYRFFTCDQKGMTS